MFDPRCSRIVLFHQPMEVESGLGSAAMAGSSLSAVLSSMALKLPELEWKKVKRLFTRKGRSGTNDGDWVYLLEDNA